ncbi:hypothetical protein PGTUg99_027513 [Puccinia graminis f. sp. tritici]|uniref:Uncharacterized protein n=1 Tax=Puccinia graminis f. sp. tritici TaxID=56615 RepID=A0A5B0QQV1_PUCGR|nr:hypothetical protein PGTUg99_027513 [Puccinia graminis f. sp. tritici]
MSGYSQIQNVSALIPTIEALDGTATVLPRWQSWIEDVLGMQNTLNIVKGNLPRPKEDPKDSTPYTRPPDSKGYNPKESKEDWDALSETACALIRLTLTDPLAQRYRKVKPAS